MIQIEPLNPITEKDIYFLQEKTYQVLNDIAQTMPYLIGINVGATAQLATKLDDNDTVHDGVVYLCNMYKFYEGRKDIIDAQVGRKNGNAAYFTILKRAAEDGHYQKKILPTEPPDTSLVRIHPGTNIAP